MIFFLLGMLSIVSSAAATGPVPVSRSGLAGINGFTFYDPDLLGDADHGRC